jgi:hypothetical protein
VAAVLAVVGTVTGALITVIHRDRNGSLPAPPNYSLPPPDAPLHERVAALEGAVERILPRVDFVEEQADSNRRHLLHVDERLDTHDLNSKRRHPHDGE